MIYYVYILYSIEYDKYYVGQTNNYQKRLQMHNNGFSASTVPFRPWKLVCLIKKENRSEAMKLEKKLKNLSRDRLKMFIEKYS